MRRIFGGLGFLLMVTLLGTVMFKTMKRKKYYVLIENRLKTPVVFELRHNGKREEVKLVPKARLLKVYSPYQLQEDLVMEVKVLENRTPHQRVILPKYEASHYLKGAFVYYDGGYPDLRLRREG